MSTQRQPKRPTVKGPEEWFTGDVYFNAYYAGEEPSRARQRPSLPSCTTSTSYPSACKPSCTACANATSSSTMRTRTP